MACVRLPVLKTKRVVTKLGGPTRLSMLVLCGTHLLKWSVDSVLWANIIGWRAELRKYGMFGYNNMYNVVISAEKFAKLM